MAIDPSISLRVQGIEAPNPLLAYGQVAQIQNAQNQNALAQYQLGAAKRTDEQQNALNKIISENYDQNTGQINMKGLVGGLAAGGHGALIPQQLAAEQERQTKAATLQKTHAEIVGLQKKYVDDVARNLSADPSDSNIIKHAQGIQQGNFSAELKSWAADQEKILLSMKPDQRKAYLEKSGATAGDFVSAANNAATVAEQARGHTLQNERAIETNKISKENQRREGDPAFQQQMAEAKALGTNMAKDKVLRATQLPKVLDTAEMTLREIDDLIGKRDKDGNLLKGEAPHPGFETAVGSTYLPGARFIPGAPAADFQKRFDQIKGGAFLQAFETLKGGGSITNVEGDKGTAALNRMDLAQSEKEFVQAAREFQDIVRKGVERASKMAGTPATPAAPATPVPSVVRVPPNAITNPQFPGFSITPGTP